MPDSDRVGCLPCSHAEAHNSKLCDAVVVVICLSHSLFASSKHALAPGIPPRNAHLTLKGHPISCDANDAWTAQKYRRLLD